MSKQSLVVALLAFLTCIPGIPPADAQPSAPALVPARPAVVLVELFTSEGCSSCPPADRLLEKVNGKRSTAGQLIVGISEHVTYWNRMGWTDPFSDETYTERQSAYGDRFKLDSVYTPQMVIDGREQILGSSGTELAAALQKEAQQSTLDLNIVSAQRSGKELAVRFSVGALPSNHAPVDIVAVIADDIDHSHVLRGENAERTLDHVAVARSLTRVAKVRASGEQTVQIKLPSSVTADLGSGHHVILFAQAAGQGPVLGADARAF